VLLLLQLDVSLREMLLPCEAGWWVVGMQVEVMMMGAYRCG
jgi:hypothetical protein